MEGEWLGMLVGQVFVPKKKRAKKLLVKEVSAVRVDKVPMQGEYDDTH